MHPEWLNLVRAFLFPGFLAQRTNLRDNFLSAEVSRTVRNGSADLQNGSERFCRPQLCTEIFLHSFQTPQKNGQEQFLLFRIFKTFQRAALWLQGPRLQEKGVRKPTKGRELLRLSLWTGSARHAEHKGEGETGCRLQKAGSFSAVCSWKAWPLSKSYLSWKLFCGIFSNKIIQLCSLYWNIRLKVSLVLNHHCLWY